MVRLFRRCHAGKLRSHYSVPRHAWREQHADHAFDRYFGDRLNVSPDPGLLHRGQTGPPQGGQYFLFACLRFLSPHGLGALFYSGGAVCRPRRVRRILYLQAALDGLLVSDPRRYPEALRAGRFSRIHALQLLHPFRKRLLSARVGDGEKAPRVAAPAGRRHHGDPRARQKFLHLQDKTRHPRSGEI